MARRHGISRRSSRKLRQEWQEAGKRFDRAFADLFLQRGGLAADEPPPRVVELLLGDCNRHVIQEYRRRGVFDPDRYMPRRLEADIALFLEQREAVALLIAGLTGSGKTNLLLHLSETLDPSAYQPVVVPCRTVDAADLVEAAFAILGLPRFTPEAAAARLAAFPGKTWVLMFEGLNEWPSFKLEYFRQAVREIAQLVREQGSRNLKVIFSVRSEFLQERLADFRLPEGSPPEACIDLFFHARSGRRRPFLELVCSERPAETEAVSELQVLYEHYRSLAGHRPKATFDQLSDPVRRMISLPLLLAIFVQRYDGKEVPEGGLRSSLIEDIVLPILNQRGEASEVFRQDAADLLKGLAGRVFERQDAELGNSYREIKRQVWHDRFIIEALLSDSPILSCTKAERDDLYISFRSDWFYEYFLAGHLWDEHYRGGGEISEEILRRVLARAADSREETHLARAFVFLAEWTLTRQAWQPGLILLLLNLEERPDFARGFAYSFLDFLRLHTGFDRPLEGESKERGASFASLLDEGAGAFTERGWRRLLDYVEHLETVGEYGAALRLLEAPVRLWERLGSGELSARRVLSIAYNRFSRHEIDEAYTFAQKSGLDALPAELTAKRRFILGRCLQFQGRYREALDEFTRGGAGASPFAYRCRHQRAFIKFMEESDYRGARAELETIIPNPLLAEEDDQGSEPRLLHASCLVNLGEYKAAEEALRKVIEARRRARRSHKEGTACRALADLHLRRFQRDAALAETRRALECLESSGHFLSRAYALEVQAAARALLDGDLGQAAEDLEGVIELSRSHGPSLSWALQSRALVNGLAGEDRALEEALAEARRHGLSPYQELRQHFIQLLLDVLRRVRPEDVLASEVRALRQAYEERGWRWYPGILDLMRGALTGKVAQTPVEALALFGEDVDGEGLTRSYLCARIFAAA